MRPRGCYPRAGWIGVFIGIELDAVAVFGLLAGRIALHLCNVGALVLAHPFPALVFDGEARPIESTFSGGSVDTSVSS